MMIAAPICEGKNYSINDWLHIVALMIQQRPNDHIDVVFGLNNSSKEYQDKLGEIELTPFGPDKTIKPIILRLPQKGRPTHKPLLHQKERVARTIGRQREQLRDYAIKGDYDWLFFLDTDTIPPTDAIEALLKTQAVFASGVYLYKHTDRVVATWLVDKKRDLCSNIPLEEVKKAAYTDTPITIRACGFGCVLLHRSVFGLIPFEWDFDENQSEDIRYCQRAAEHGIEIILVPRVMCQHKSDAMYKIETLDRPGFRGYRRDKIKERVY